MRKIYFISIILVFFLAIFTRIVFAKEVNLDMVQRVGIVQLQVQKQIRLSKALTPIEYSIRKVRLLKDTPTGEILAYILDLAPKGFIAISTDTNIRPVIAYSYHSNFSMKDVEGNILLYMLKKDMKNRLEAISITDERIKSINNQLWKRFFQRKTHKPLYLS